MLFIPRIWDIALPILMVVDSGDQLGRTVADYGKGNVNVALEVDVQKAAPNLIEMIL